MSSSSRSLTLRISRVGLTNSNTRYPDLRQCKTAVQQSGARSNVGKREPSDSCNWLARAKQAVTARE